MSAPGRLEAHLRARRDQGRALLVPYVTAGVVADWTDHARALADAGADAVEIGLPFSDPMLDGPVVQQAAQRALGRGTTPQAAIEALGRLDLGLPLIAMTYLNVVLRRGRADFCARLRDSGVSALIVVDCPFAEAGPLSAVAGEHGLELVPLVAPSTPASRLPRIAAAARGFVYAATGMSPTGERPGRLEPAGRLAARVRAHTSTPVLLGFGVATPADAVRAAGSADGVVVGSALMRRVLAGAGPAEVGAFAARLRVALDGLDRREGAGAAR